MKKIIPAVSIITPMYNTEKYIGECLDSILAQTFKDYEVIVVDDCSTDNSCAIVESYIPKFKGRLQLIHSEKNSGSRPGIPRNTGIRFARGEYILFVDSDDAITKTALDELYNLAKKFDVDIVYCEKFFRVKGIVPSMHLRKDLPISSGDQKGGFVTEPTLETNNLAELIQKFCAQHFEVATWNKLLRRSLIVSNEITFPNTRTYEDFIFNFKLFCCAKKILRTPTPIFYMYRDTPNSNSKSKDNVEKTLNFRINPLVKGFKMLNDFMSGMKFFQKNLHYRYAVLNFFANLNLRFFVNLAAQNQPYLVYEFLRQGELKDLKKYDVLAAYIFSFIGMQHANLLNAQNLISRQPKEVQDFQQQQAIIRQQAAQIQQLQQQLENQLQK